MSTNRNGKISSSSANKLQVPGLKPRRFIAAGVPSPTGGDHESAFYSLHAVCVASVGPFAIRGSSQQGDLQTQRFPQFENDDVRVWKSLVLPNAPLTMHRHDHPRVIIALQGGTMKIVEQGGASEQHVWETGKAYWLPANPPNTMHADVNAGDKPIDVMVVELKHEK